MDKRTFGMVMCAIVIVPTAAMVYSAVQRVPYLVGLRNCSAWAATVVVLMLANYWVADWVFSGGLAAAKQSSGYARGHRVISPYGFVVQTLLIAEIVGIVLIRKRFRPRQPGKE